MPNPLCASAPGCGAWTRPNMPNPDYKGKWYPPMIDNPAYKGVWQGQREHIHISATATHVS